MPRAGLTICVKTCIVAWKYHPMLTTILEVTMKKLTTIALVALLALSNVAFAKDFYLKYDGKPVEKNMHLNKGDVVHIDTTIPVNTQFFVTATTVGQPDEGNFKFKSSVVGVVPERNDAFTDSIWTGANPGKVTYEFAGDEAVDANFAVSN